MEHLGISLDTDEFETPCEFLIFTHSAKTRLFVLASFCIYIAVFVLFISHLKDQLKRLEELPASLKELEEGSGILSSYGLLVLGFLMACVIFFYLFWAVVDVWGLQVHLSRKRIQVRNTVTGSFMKKLTGVGELNLDDLQKVEGGFFSTRLKGEKGSVRFTPVERIEILISCLMEYAPKIKFDVK